MDKLLEECNEEIEETSLVKINSTRCKHNSCLLYIVLFSIFFTISIGIGAYFVYFKYMNRNKKMFLRMIMFIMQKIINQTCIKYTSCKQRIQWV